MTLKKPAETSKPVHALIAERWSPRAFQETPVANDILLSLFEAARWAASCNNSQPWRFIVATSDAAADWEAAQNCANERNQSWTRKAPVIGFVCAYKMLPNGNPSPTSVYDSGMAMAQLILQATEHGLVVHQMAGIDKDKVRETYSVPDDTDVICGFVLGYQGETDALPEVLAGREVEPRVRQDLGDMVFSKSFGKASPIVG